MNFNEILYGVAYYDEYMPYDRIETDFKMVLSKILCKWKQDSVVSLFLYLNSVFKHKASLRPVQSYTVS